MAESGQNSVASVLTDLSADPGEETNVKDQPEYAEALNWQKKGCKLELKKRKINLSKIKNVTPVFTLKIHPKRMKPIRQLMASVDPLPFGVQIQTSRRCNMPSRN